MKSNGLRSRHQRRRPGRRIDRRLRPTAPRGRTRAGHGPGREHGLLCRLRLHAPARLGRRATELVRHAATRPRPSSTVAKLCSPPPSVHMHLADPHRSDAQCRHWAAPAAYAPHARSSLAAGRGPQTAAALRARPATGRARTACGNWAALASRPQSRRA